MNKKKSKSKIILSIIVGVLSILLVSGIVFRHQISEYGHSTPQNSIRWYLLNEGFVIEAFQIDIEKGSEIEDTVDPLKKNEALYTVSPGVDGKNINTPLRTFLVTEINGKYYTTYFGEV
ncbi:hypothetical protein [Vagococcus xieshaowenii]|uniref:Uncharacterized protein n=1 Tax=Vagococcus xieshaowenii TaxID=2562451 RepID=A0AAJ5JMB1_9ENTE|nr:hypothetical protein [Vagococcus xieshaowenii]TFZ42929.1 hypothetical protein E4031_01460 [Vagococcus xieshaowenii]